MTESPSVCYVLNTVGETSVPARLAVAQARELEMDVGILAWFRVEEFDGIEEIEVRCAEAPRTTLGVDRNSLSTTKEMISEYDVMQTHHNHSGTYAKPIARYKGVPIVSVEQNNHRGFTRKGRFTNALTNLFADRIVCSSMGVRDSFKRWEELITRDSKTTIIYNGADIYEVREDADPDWSLREHIGADPDSYVVGTAGRLIEQKAHDVLIEAFASVVDETTEEVHLAIAGEGGKKQELQEQAREEDVEDQVHFLGLLERKHLYCLYDQADVYAMPSRWEGFSAAAVEAMAAGAPCVFSDISEFYEAYEGAARFHPVDGAEALADVVAELLDDPGQRQELSEAAWSRSEDYSTEKIAGKYLSLYEEVLDN